MFETDGRRSTSSSPDRRHRINGADDDDDEDDPDADPVRRRRLGSRSGGNGSRRSDRRHLVTGCELISSDEEDDLGGIKLSSGSRVARLEESRCEAVRSQCAVLTLLLHRHARLMSELASEIAGEELGFSAAGSSSALLHSSGQKLGLSKETLQHVAFWLKGRLVQVVLEHYDQLIPYLDNLDEFICGAHPEVQDVFQQLRALHA
ncbi:unnamed protein product [Dicrocoelium dendriticum]|nr:unnamed protein product [Dicrocoelium dendriticum]